MWGHSGVFELGPSDAVLKRELASKKRHWVSALLALMPSEINQLMAREAEEKFDDYDYIKDLLLKRFKLSAEIFRQKFVKHQRNPAQSWRDFVFEITSYFEEWLGGLGVNDFEGLKNLMITDQLKRRVPGDVREQFIDDWVKSIVPGDLADKLDEYESVRANVKGAHSNDTSHFVKAKTCQLRRGLTYRDRIPITPIVRPENPFEVWSVDCIGPLEPSSRRGHKYIICAVDICTRWAEAVPVRNIKAKTTCEVLMRIFTQTGFPRIICTDQGTNFTAELTEAFKDALGIAPRFATPGHPESMGAVERWNRTLKEMLNKNIQENGNNWDSHLPYLMFAYREVPHSTTGVSPYQLVYGRLPNGPLKLLKEVWTGGKEIPTGSSKSIEEYLRDLTEKLKQAHNLARGNSEKAQAEYASRYNLRSREKRLAVGDQVLVLIPSSSHKLLKNGWVPHLS
ncbi:retrovirus-related Pol polyprotein from transposon 412 [Trichonephila clavipes]|uniref:Retrovirus-related Pol polyprotein from transposon 412 n=1 Tax=Trichonephila clavipes TaxID=2585209 RepID=A0A8X6R7C8_TRICX|nr:retrovirus-related Pol polyprotein from transposon 412 [Trichonephila clavipes]